MARSPPPPPLEGETEATSASHPLPPAPPTTTATAAAPDTATTTKASGVDDDDASTANGDDSGESPLIIGGYELAWSFASAPGAEEGRDRMNQAISSSQTHCDDEVARDRIPNDDLESPLIRARPDTPQDAFACAPRLRVPRLAAPFRRLRHDGDAADREHPPTPRDGDDPTAAAAPAAADGGDDDDDDTELLSVFALADGHGPRGGRVAQVLWVARLAEMRERPCGQSRPATGKRV